jgi:serine phosphatase RsbU (regulator of sigma subunit)
VIGDVCGKGAEAASLTAMARHTLRTLARHHDRPGPVLEAANEAIAGQLPEGRFCTVAAAALEPGADGLRVTVAIAGHPVPIVVRGTGEVALLGRAGMLLGVFDELGVVEQDVVLAAGDALVLFTDGCVGEGADSLQVLGACLAATAGQSAAAMAEAVETTAVELEGDHRDDMAILVVKA